MGITKIVKSGEDSWTVESHDCIKEFVGVSGEEVLEYLGKYLIAIDNGVEAIL